MRQPLGQHFLRDPKTIHTIVSAAELSRQETALEIGPGKGVLTSALVGKVKKLIAVELDSALASRLAAQWASESAVQIVHGDFLRQDLDALVPWADRPVKLLGNLPYSITSPIFEKILAWPHWETGVFLIQKEVAERMRSAEGSRVYGILSLAVQLFATVESLLTVGPGAFQPPPEVDSSVFRLRRNPGQQPRVTYRRRQKKGRKLASRAGNFSLAAGRNAGAPRVRPPHGAVACFPSRKHDLTGLAATSTIPPAKVFDLPIFPWME
jgi:16S rRNA (adenine1518-N6/adenine1519-N6)-dimethyltransferase